MARAAWRIVHDVHGSDEAAQFRSRVMGLPAMLQSAGLIATVAFLQARAGDGGSGLRRAYGLVVAALGERLAPAGEASRVLDWLASCDAASYRRAAADAREFAVWLRRAAEAELPAERPGDGDDGGAPQPA
jgi:CRISPR type III-B/RAMP module-associated protein Cmr5